MEKPEYKNAPLAAMLPVPEVPGQQYPRLWLWGGFWYNNSEDPAEAFSLDAISRLTALGYQQAPSNGVVETQLYDVVRLADLEHEKLHYWYKSEGKRTPPPVILVFSIDANPAPEPVPLLSPVPVPQLGEYALVENMRGELQTYHILSLPLAARQRWIALGEKLKQLSAPLMWPAFTERHQIASNELVYQRELAALETQQRLALPNSQARMDYLLRAAQLKAAHIHIEELRKALDQTDWLDQWHEIQHMVQDLADDYYEHHQAQETPRPMAMPEQSPLPLDLPEPPAPAEKPAKQKKPRVTRQKTDIITRNKDYVTIKSDIIYQQIVKALRDKGKYKIYEEANAAEYRQRFHKDKGQIIITIRPGEDEPFEVVIHALNTLGDECIDTYVAVMAIALERNGTDRVSNPFNISPDEILEVRKRKKSRS